ncbi:tRNA (adenosine(37)-N6)-threonylcarbamoyltransferase complex ATPase subunit type 1 TsaE [bacterium]|nr:tRNA (adenosine(37)-N6)-threonylcarbamoyltransferase complex ATPase subunit type 1 TsaE [bacterium]
MLKKEIVHFDKIDEFINNLAEIISAPIFIGLKGEMGAGKTTLTRHLIQKLLKNSKIVVTSPTFTLINVYDETPPIVHADFFRLESYDDLVYSGIEEYIFDSDYIVIAEWYDKIDFKIPLNSILISISIISEFEREISIEIVK